MSKAIIENLSGVTIHGLRPGEKLTIEVDRDGTPLDKNWRRRCSDFKIDGAVSLSILAEPDSKKKKGD